MRLNKEHATELVIKAACGHEYKTTIHHDDEEEFRELADWFAELECPDCIRQRYSAKAEEVVQP
jgi:hypothetical protein